MKLLKKEIDDIKPLFAAQLSASDAISNWDLIPILLQWFSFAFDTRPQYNLRFTHNFISFRKKNLESNPTSLYSKTIINQLLTSLKAPSYPTGITVDSSSSDASSSKHYYFQQVHQQRLALVNNKIGH